MLTATVQQRDSIIHTNTYIYIYINIYIYIKCFIFFSVVVSPRILNIVPYAVEPRGLSIPLGLADALGS